MITQNIKQLYANVFKVRLLIFILLMKFSYVSATSIVQVRYIKYYASDKFPNLWMLINITQLACYNESDMITYQKSVTVSSINLGWSGPESTVTNGNLIPKNDKPDIFHSDNLQGDWVKIDLASNFFIVKCTLVNRSNCCWYRVDGARIALLDENSIEVATKTINSSELIIDVDFTDTTNCASGSCILPNNLCVISNSASFSGRYLTSTEKNSRCRCSALNSCVEADGSCNPLNFNGITRYSDKGFCTLTCNMNRCILPNLECVDILNQYNSPTQVNDKCKCKDTLKCLNEFTYDCVIINANENKTRQVNGYFLCVSINSIVKVNYVKLNATTMFPGSGYINISQLVCFDNFDSNITKNKPVTGSSLFDNSHSYSQVNNGDEFVKNYPNIYHSGSSNGDDWINIDLIEAKLVTRCKLYNRGDCCKQNSIGVKISLLDSNNVEVAFQVINSQNDVIDISFVKNDTTNCQSGSCIMPNGLCVVSNALVNMYKTTTLVNSLCRCSTKDSCMGFDGICIIPNLIDYNKFHSTENIMCLNTCDNNRCVLPNLKCVNTSNLFEITTQVNKKCICLNSKCLDPRSYSCLDPSVYAIYITAQTINNFSICVPNVSFPYLKVRYIKLHAPTSGVNSYINISQLICYDKYGVNVTYKKSVSGTDVGDFSRSLNKITDGSELLLINTSAYNSLWSNSSIVTIDLSEEIEIDRCRIYNTAEVVNQARIVGSKLSLVSSTNVELSYSMISNSDSLIDISYINNTTCPIGSCFLTNGLCIVSTAFGNMYAMATLLNQQCACNQCICSKGLAMKIGSNFCDELECLLNESYLYKNNITTCVSSCPQDFPYKNNKDKYCLDICSSQIVDEANKICYLCDSLYYFNKISNTCVSSCDSNSNVFLKLCVLACPKTYYLVGNVCTPCPVNTQYVYNNTCYQTCFESTFRDDINMICTDCVFPNNLIYNNQCVQFCLKGFAVRPGTNICESLVCNINENLLYLNNVTSCTLTCPASFYIVNNVCIECPVNTPFVYNNVCIEFCPNNTETNDVKKLCSDCLPPNIYISNNKCVLKCPDKTGVRYDVSNNITNICSPCLNDEVLSIYKICIKNSSCDFNLYGIDLVKGECTDCKLENKIKFNNQCLLNCPPGYESHSTEICRLITTTINLVENSTILNLNSSLVNNQEALTCNKGELIVNKLVDNKKIETCQTCFNAGKYRENGNCVDNCSINATKDTTNLECLLCKNKLQRNGMSYECVENCIEPYYVLDLDPNTCVNCKTEGLLVSSIEKKCVQKCEPKSTEIQGNCKLCKDTSLSFILENSCVSKCPDGYSILNLKGENICRIIIPDPVCTDDYCSNKGICSVNPNGNLKCDCTKTGFFGLTCTKISSDVENISNKVIDSINRVKSDSSSNFSNQQIETVISDLNEVMKIPEAISDKINELADSIALKQLSDAINTSNITVELSKNTFELIDTSFSLKISDEANKNVSQLKNGIEVFSDNVVKNLGDLGIFLDNNSNKGGVIYQGDTFTIQISDMSDKSILEARENKFPIVDYSECQEILKSAGIISSNEKLYTKNIHYSSHLLEDQESIRNVKSISKGVTTKIVDSKGNDINTELCDSFKLKLPINNNNIDVNTQEKLKELGVDVFNSTDDWFNDICRNFQSNNNTDITLSSRRQIFNVTSACSQDCEYKGVDEYQYAICECTETPKEVTSSFVSSVFDSLKNSNIRLFRCASKIFNKTVSKNLGFISFTTFSIASSIIICLHFALFSNMTNISSIFVHDAVTILPNMIGNIKKFNDIKEEQENNIPKNILYENNSIKNSSIPCIIENNSLIFVNKSNDDLKIKVLNQHYSKDKSFFSKSNSNSIKKIYNNQIQRFNNSNIYDSYCTNTTPQKIGNLTTNKQVFSELNNEINIKNLENSIIINHANNNSSSEHLQMNNYIIKKEEALKKVAFNMKTGQDYKIQNNKNFNDNLEPYKNNNIIIDFNNGSPAPVQNSILNNEQIVIKTKADIAVLPINLRLKLDQRSSLEYFIDDLKETHPIVNIIFVKSVLNPFFIRLIDIIFGWSLSFSLNALFFTDAYINKQAQVKTSNGSNATGFIYILLNEFSKSLWSMLITIIIMIFVGLIKKVPEKFKRTLNASLISNDKSQVSEGMYDFYLESYFKIK